MWRRRDGQVPCTIEANQRLCRFVKAMLVSDRNVNDMAVVGGDLTHAPPNALGPDPSVVSRTLALVALRREVGAAAMQYLEQPLRAQVLQHVAQLMGLPRSARATLEATWIAAVRTPVAPGLRYLHRDWIEAALADAPNATRAALASGSLTPAAVWLARWFCAGMPGLPPLLADSAPLRTPPDVVALAGPRLLRLVSAVGADGVVHALGAPALRACDASVLAANQPLLQAALARLAQPQPWPGGLRRRIVAWLTAAQHVTTGGMASPLLLPMVGVQMLATVAAIDPQQLAVKLPRVIGQQIWAGPGPVLDRGAAAADLDCLPWSIVMAAAA